MPSSVFVTGASRGIGRATALHLAAAGWDVHAGVRRPEDGDALVRDAAGRGQIFPVPVDVTDAAQVAALPGLLPERLEAVVNNAGIVVGGPVETVPLDELRRQLDVNVVAQVAVTQALLPVLRRSRGRIVFVSSISGRVATPMTGPYNASKFALEGIADALRMELSPWKIPVVLVEPGSVDTDIWRSADEQAVATEQAMDDEQRRLYAGHVRGMRAAIPRIQKQAGSPAKVAQAIETALTAKRPRARYVVGADARMQTLMLAALPTSAFDVVLRKFTGTPRS